VFNLKDSVDPIVEKLVQETLIPMFRRLHPQQSGWSLTLMNIGITNMVEAASEDGKGTGRDIARMFMRQKDVLKYWRVEDKDVPPDPIPVEKLRDEAESDNLHQAEPSASNEAMDVIIAGSEDMMFPTQNTIDERGLWEDDVDGEGLDRCDECGCYCPAFAITAHQRLHNMEE